MVNREEFLKAFQVEGYPQYIQLFDSHGNALKPFRLTPNDWFAIDFNNRAGCTVAFYVNKGGTTSNEIEVVTAHFMEIDEDENGNPVPIEKQWQMIKEFPLEPSAVVYSGGKSLHVYWLVRDADILKFEHVQDRLIKHFHSDGQIKNINRAMRLPGTINPKTGKMATVEFWKPNNVYTQEDIIAVTPDVDTPLIKPRYELMEYEIDDKIEGLIRRIEQYAELKPTSKEGKFTLCCLNPNHDDSNPSAWIDFTTSVYGCSGCMEKPKRMDYAFRDFGLDELVDYIFINNVYKWTGGIIESLDYMEKEYLPRLESWIKDVVNQEVLEVMDSGNIPPNELSIVKKTVKDVVEVLEARGETVTEEWKKDISSIVTMMAHNRKLEKLVAVNGKPGFGKSTIIKLFLKNALQMDHQFGAVVVCRTIEELESYYRFLRGEEDINGNRVDEKGNPLVNPREAVEGLIDNTAIILKSWTPELCINEERKAEGEYTHGMCRKTQCPFHSECPWIEQFKIQDNYRVVLMTHERMKMNSERPLEFKKEFGYWGTKHNKNERKVLIIDEAPEIVNVTILNKHTADKMLDAVRRQVEIEEKKDGKNRQHLIDEMENIYNNVFKELGQHAMKYANYHSIRFEYETVGGKKAKSNSAYVPIELKGNITEDLVQLMRMADSELGKILKEIKHAVDAKFAILTVDPRMKQEENWVVGFARWEPLYLQPFNTFIMDGTADVNIVFSNKEKFLVYKPKPVRTYENWEIIHIPYNTSSTALRLKSEEINLNIRKVVENMLIRHERVLVVTLKENKEALINTLRDLIDAGRAYVAHDMGPDMIGSNKFKDYTAILYASHVERPPVYYEALGYSFFMEARDMEPGDMDPIMTFKSNYETYYDNARIQAVKITDKLKAFLQGIHRINRDKNDKRPVEIVILDRDPILPKYIHEYLPGSKFEEGTEWDFLKRSPKAGTKKSKIVEVAKQLLNESEDGRIQKKELRKHLGYANTKKGKENFRLALNEVKDELAKEGIVVKTRTLEFVK